ncbi:MAG: TonB-dependent receptor [Bacteroidia bacterium]|nr:TonB-dependent receptor [Bacteroidia bacterium]
MQKIGLLFLVFFFSAVYLFGQPFPKSDSERDSFYIKNLDEIVITATRTERKLSNVAVPVQLINNKTIQQSGSVRLNDILQEQTGLFITNSSAASSAGGGVFGNGVQIQGLSPDYTLILIDGEPIIGRQGGIIDLSRLTIANIKKIEIVKGPSSSLYGSEAMGGVVNIITVQAKNNSLEALLRYGRFNSTDANFTGSVHKAKWGLQLFGNRNSSDGFDLDKTTPGKTVDPFTNYTGQLRLNYMPSSKTKISLSTRYYNEMQDNFFPVTDMSNGASLNIIGNGNTRDINVNPTIIQQFNKNLRSSLRLYFSRYEYEQTLKKEMDKSIYYHDFFQQDFYRIENQTDWHWQKNNFGTIGGGLISEKLNTTRYAGKRSNDIRYLFVQNEWRANEQLTVIGGLRYDDNSTYQSKLSPKLAAQYKVNDKLRINASYGAGFKAPDFRQQFLDFMNSAAGGYVIYGANEITVAKLEAQKQQGIITEILPRANQLAILKPEISKGLNLGANYTANEKTSFKLNLFRNDIENLIQVEIIASRSNGAPVYSYFNVRKAFTQGAELQAQYLLSKNIQLQGGYQFLITADKADLQKIKGGTIYTRDIQTGSVTQVSRNDYAGLTNRSAHMFNIKLFYDNTSDGWSGSVRAIYRSRWGTYDKDGNGIINRSDEFANGFVMLNISAAKTISNFKVQAGVDNLLNYRDILNLPGQPGIQPYISISYSFIKKS